MAAASSDCYYCHEATGHADGAFSPCATCTGTIRTVHRDCFRQAAIHRRQTHPWETAPRCTICRRFSTNPTALAIFNSVPPHNPTPPSRSSPIPIPCSPLAPLARTPAGPVAAAPLSPAAAAAFWRGLATENQLPSCAGCLHPAGTCELNCPRAVRLAAHLANPAPFDYTTPLLTPAAAAAASPPALPAPAPPKAPAAPFAAPDTGIRGLAPPVPVPRRYMPEGYTLPRAALNKIPERHASLWEEVKARRDMPGGAGDDSARWKVIGL